MNKRDFFMLTAAAGAVATTFAQGASAQGSAGGALRVSDFASLQDALNAAESRGGGTVYFDRSETIAETVYIPNHVSLIGDGSSKLTANQALGFSGVSRIMLCSKNYGLDAVAIGIRVENMILDGNNSGSAPVNRLLGIVMRKTHDFKVFRNRVANCTGYGIWALGDAYQASKYGVIAENHVTNCQVGIETLDAEGVVIRDNTIICSPQRSHSGIHPWRSRRISIYGNIVDVDGSGFSGAGIDINTCTHITLGQNDICITGNSNSSGIALLIQSDFGGYCSHITCDGGYYYSEGGAAAMIVDNQAGGDFENIAFSDVHLDGWVVALHLQPAAHKFRDIRVRDSYIVSRGAASGSQGSFGIWWRATVENLSVEGCDIIARSGPGREYPMASYALQRLHNNRFSPDPGPICSTAHLTRSLQIPNAMYTPISWMAASNNNFRAYNASSPTRLVVPSGIRRVRLAGQVAFRNSSIGARAVRLTRNGVPHLVGTATQQTDNAGSTIYSVLNIQSAALAVTPGHYFELEVYQSSGGPLDVGAANTWFSMEPVI